MDGIIPIIILIAFILSIFYFLNTTNSSKEREMRALMEKNPTSPTVNTPSLEAKLTEDYLNLDNYIGQTLGIEYIKGHIRKANNENEPLPHILLWGSGGLGKSTLVKALAHHMGGRFIELIPANLKTTKELFSRFLKKGCSTCGFESPFSTNKCLSCGTSIAVYFQPVVQVEHRDIVFLEECHGLNIDIEEAMYSLMQDGYLQVRFNGVDQRVDFPKITIAGATTRLGDLSKPFRDRFKINVKLEAYSVDEIELITKMYGEHKGLTFNDTVLTLLAKISHGTPRTAKKYIDDVSTLANHITEVELNQIMYLLKIDSNGLDGDHHKVMKYILTRMKSVKNGAAGSAAISSAVAIPKAVYEEVYEPPLLYQDFIFQSSKGRRLTDKAMNEYFPTEIKNLK